MNQVDLERIFCSSLSYALMKRAFFADPDFIFAISDCDVCSLTVAFVFIGSDTITDRGAHESRQAHRGSKITG